MADGAAVILALLLLGAVTRPPVARAEFVYHGLLETAAPDTAFTPAHDSWTGFDKLQHLSFSFLWVLGSQYVLENKVGWRQDRAAPFSAAFSLTLGVGKELYDWRLSRTRYFSKRDLVANVAGVALALLVIKL